VKGGKAKRENQQARSTKCFANFLLIYVNFLANYLLSILKFGLSVSNVRFGLRGSIKVTQTKKKKEHGWILRYLD